MPKLFPCTITVTKGGTPVSGANILLFSPQLPGSLATSGQTNAGGVAEIGSSLANYFESGSPAGELTVVIQKTPDVPEELKLTPEEHSKMTPPESNAYSAKLAKAMKDAPKIVPDKLSSPATSPLKVTVAESKTGTHVTFELDDFN
ncbi:MAG: hypothetical protein FWH27_05680 [Planctomycetaceae bacterium]|nr:hypothetical protein [Planctomycetaceae bacterium]